MNFFHKYTKVEYILFFIKKPFPSFDIMPVCFLKIKILGIIPHFKSMWFCSFVLALCIIFLVRRIVLLIGSAFSVSPLSDFCVLSIHCLDPISVHGIRKCKGRI